MYFAPIVEGHGEVEALPTLLHAIGRAAGVDQQILVNPPIRVKSGSFLNDQDYRLKQIRLASYKARERGGTVLILLDCDDGCAAELGPQLLADIRMIDSNVAALVSLATREYESWFIAAVRSLSGVGTLAEGLEPPVDHEKIRGAKEWLTGRMKERYDPITHQAPFTRAMSLDEARSNKSFDRLYRRICGLLLPTARGP
jgi:hypothetical protein